MKKILAFFLVLIMVLSVALVSCEKDKTPAASDNEDDTFVSQNSNNNNDDNNNDEADDPAPQGDWNTANYVVYAMTSLKIRSSASTKTEGNVVATVTRGTDLNAIQVSTKLDSIDKPEWYKINYNNQECYVVGAFVTTNFNDTVFENCEPEILTIKNSGISDSPHKVNLRSNPAVADSTLANIVLTHVEATAAGELKKIGANKSGTWFIVSYDNDKNGTPETYYIKMTQSIRNYFGLNGSSDDAGGLG